MTKNPTASWTVEPVSHNVHVIRFKKIKSGWKHKIMLSADRHWDNPHSDRKLQAKHLKEAKATDSPIIDIGDFFCLMQGKFDPRKNMDDLRPEHKVEDYFDAVVDTAEQWFAPYADQLAVIAMGNHETSVLKRNQINMTNAITRRLSRHSTRGGPFNGQYAGWVFLRFHINGTKQETIRIKYHHGYGGGGPVTRGVIQTNRRAVYMPDADVVASGHIHEAWSVSIPRERISNGGTIYHDNQWHISVPSYKEEYAQGSGGFHIEKGRPPKPVGCVWLNLELTEGRDARIKVSPHIDV